MAIFITKQNPLKIQILFLSPRGKSFIEPKYLMEAINWIKHAWFLTREKWDLIFAPTHSDIIFIHPFH